MCDECVPDDPFGDDPRRGDPDPRDKPWPKDPFDEPRRHPPEGNDCVGPKVICRES